jgi:F-type H+-transporting ATPase subunit delta
LTQPQPGVARRYAQAAYMVASRKRQIEGWRQDLATLEDILTDPDVALAFDNPRLDDGRRLALALGLLPEGFDKERANLLKLLVLRRRTGLISEVRAGFEALVAEAEGRTELEVTVAAEMDADATARLQGLLNQKLGREVTVGVRVDPAIIGGVIIRRGDHVTDGSLRRRLAEMREALLAG